MDIISFFKNKNIDNNFVEKYQNIKKLNPNFFSCNIEFINMLVGYMARTENRIYASTGKSKNYLNSNTQSLKAELVVLEDILCEVLENTTKINDSFKEEINKEEKFKKMAFKDMAEITTAEAILIILSHKYYEGKNFEKILKKVEVLISDQHTSNDAFSFFINLDTGDYAEERNSNTNKIINLMLSMKGFCKKLSEISYIKNNERLTRVCENLLKYKELKDEDLVKYINSGTNSELLNKEVEKREIVNKNKDSFDIRSLTKRVSRPMNNPAIEIIKSFDYEKKSDYIMQEVYFGNIILDILTEEEAINFIKENRKRISECVKYTKLIKELEKCKIELNPEINVDLYMMYKDNEVLKDLVTRTGYKNINSVLDIKEEKKAKRKL